MEDLLEAITTIIALITVIIMTLIATAFFVACFVTALFVGLVGLHMIFIGEWPLRGIVCVAASYCILSFLYQEVTQ